MSPDYNALTGLATGAFAFIAAWQAKHLRNQIKSPNGRTTGEITEDSNWKLDQLRTTVDVVVGKVDDMHDDVHDLSSDIAHVAVLLGKHLSDGHGGTKK